MILTGFEEKETATVFSWLDSPEVYRIMTCGQAKWPPPSDLVSQWQGDSASSWLLRDVGGEPLAYGEIWLSENPEESELKHLLVDPSLRGHGIGQTLTRALSAESMENELVSSVVLQVYSDNQAAIACYRKVGFVIVGDGDLSGCSAAGTSDCEKAKENTQSEPKPVLMKLRRDES